MPREQDVPVDGLTLRAQVWGAADGPPLVALHGWLDNAGSFATLAPLLAVRWRVIALELPGHGHSGHLPAGAGYGIADYVRTVLAGIDALGLADFALLGHSLGAGIAALVAAARPAQVRRLDLIEGLGPLADEGDGTLARFREALAPRTGAARRLRVFRDVDQAVSARTLASGLPAAQARPIVERALVAVDGGWCWRSDPRLTRATPVRLAEAQVRALLAGIAAPTRVLLARPATPYLPTALMQARAARVPSIAMAAMEGGHHLHLEHPAAVAAWHGAAPGDPPA